MQSKICEIIGIEYPIFQGGMAWVSEYNLAAAVSEAGGLGIIAAGNADANYVRDQVRKIREITDKPFGVNVMLLSPYVEEVIKVIIEEKVPVITTGAGNPGKYVKSLKKVGTKIFPVVPSVALAKRMEREGVDGLIAEGTESGGHIGEITTMCIVPQIVDAVSIPVIAAGGIADSRGFLAALALGAEGIQIGTRFICSEECRVHQNYKIALLNAKERDAIATGRTTGHPVRCLKNKITRDFKKLEEKAATPEEFEKLGTGALKKAAIYGDIEYGTVMAGQISGMIQEIKPCKEIINDLIQGFNKEFDNLKRMVE